MAEKILGVGFHKTGTTSLGSALKTLGYSWQGWSESLSMEFHAGNIDALLKATDAREAFEDFPWPLLFKEIHARHPDTKFILTRRENMDVWFESLVRHCDRNPPTKSDFRRHLYGIEHPREDPEHVKAVHQKHIEDVRQYAQRYSVPLLEVCFTPGKDSWIPICDFLGKPIPNKPFPVSNQATSGTTRQRIVRKIKNLTT